MMAGNFGHKIVISMKSTNMPVSILPQTKSFKVLCVCIAWPPCGFKHVDHGQKQKA